MKIWGSPAQRKGIPDRLAIVRGRAVWLEVKRPGEEPTAIQQKTIEELRAEGCVAEVVVNAEVVERIVDGMNNWETMTQIDLEAYYGKRKLTDVKQSMLTLLLGEVIDFYCSLPKVDE